MSTISKADHTKSLIEVRNVTYSYTDKQDILSDINLDIHLGDFLGIIGPNGGGKSTLIKLILGLIPIQKGEIKSLCKNIAYIGQKATNFDQKFPATVFDIVLMGRYTGKSLFKKLSEGDKKTAEEAIEQVGMTDYKDRLIGDLSGGQQQRVFIARALAQNPDMIFLDEPTSGVDQESQVHFYEILRDLNQKRGITLVIVSHDVDVITQEVTEIAAINRSLVFYGLAKEFIKEEHGIKFIKHGHH